MNGDGVRNDRAFIFDPATTADPVVADGIMYIVQPPNDIIALDAATGRPFWTYSYNPSPQARPCCGRLNRGVAIQGDRLFMGTIDGHMHMNELVALAVIAAFGAARLLGEDRRRWRYAVVMIALLVYIRR